MSTSSTIQISVKEALMWYGKLALEFSMSPIADAERIAIVLERLRDDVAEKRLAWQDALGDEIVVENPEDPTQGTLPALRARIAKLEREGAAWGKEYSAPMVLAARKEKLQAWMQEADRNIEKVSLQIVAKEKQLKILRDTTARREGAYRKALADYNQLREFAPAMIEQTRALKEAQAECVRAIEETGGAAITDTGAILQQLEETLAEAQAGDTAARMIDDRTVKQETIDEVIAAQDAQARSSERVSRWISNN